jgi:hypothetical protein
VNKEEEPSGDPRALNLLDFGTYVMSYKSRRRMSKFEKALVAIAHELIEEGVIEFDPETVSFQILGRGELPKDVKNVIHLPRNSGLK